jgi:hypothetical protein
MGEFFFLLKFFGVAVKLKEYFFNLEQDKEITFPYSRK